MTKRELNRDIKRLAKKFVKWQEGDKSILEADLNLEFRRLYHADREMTNLNRTSILLMLRMQKSLQVIPNHIFGLFIEIEKLIK